MPTRSSTSSCLVDTSAAVAMLVVDHPHHETAFAALEGRRLGLAGHAVFETMSVLTRLPPPLRLAPADVLELLDENFPENRFISPAGAGLLMQNLGRLGIGGGQVYDALVGATAAEHGLTLVTRDRRALDTYRALGVELELLA